MTQTIGSAQSSESAASLRELRVPAALAMLVLSASILFLFLTPDSSRYYPLEHDGPPLAQVMSVQNEVRHKNAGTIVWGSPQSGADLFKKDAIATMQSSRVVLSFPDGSEVVLEPETMIILEEAPRAGGGIGGSGRIVARLVRGSITRRKSGSAPLFIAPTDEALRDGTGLIQIEDAARDSIFRIIHRAEGLEVVVESGTVRVSGKEVRQGERARAGRQGVDVRKKGTPLPAPKLKQPRIRIERGYSFLDVLELFFWVRSIQADDFETGSDDPEVAVTVRFAWESLEGALGYRIQISKDSGFEDLVVDRRIGGTAFEQRFDQPEKDTNYFFRVAALDADGESGEFSNVERVQIRPDASVEETAVAKKVPSKRPQRAQTQTKKTPKPVAKKIVKPGPPHRHKLAPPETKEIPKVAAAATESKAEAVPKGPRWRMHTEAALGALFMARDFRNTVFPERSGGTGFTPASLAADLIFSHDQKARIGLFIRALPQTATPRADAISDVSIGVPLIQGQVAWMWNSKTTTWSIGPAASLSSSLAWDDVTLESTQRILLGIGVRATPNLSEPNRFRWQADLNPYFVGDKGTDLNFSLAMPLGRGAGQVRWLSYSGFFGRIGIQSRWLQNDRFWSAGAEGGYAL